MNEKQSTSCYDRIDHLPRPTDGEWYNGFAPGYVDKLHEVAERLFEFNQVLRPSQVAERQAVIRSLFLKTGERFIINAPFHCDHGNIILGEDFIGNFNLTILDEALVTFGNNVFVGPNVSIYTIIHETAYEPRNRGIMKHLPVTVGNNVWIGGSTTILPGVTIGDGSVIGARSLVTKDIPAGVLAFGNPCKVIRPL